MEITDVRVRLAEGGNDRLRGYCTITFDGQFVVRDLRIIAGERGLFVAMPSRKVMHRCPKCGHKNHHQSRFCNECGGRLHVRNAPPSEQARLHVDIAHPITPDCRNMIQSRVLDAFKNERSRSGGRSSRLDSHESYDEYEQNETQTDHEFA